MNKAIIWSGGDFRKEGSLGWSWLQGLAKHGIKYEQHFPALLNPMSLPKGDFVVSNGHRNPIPDCIKAENSRGQDVIVYDLGYMHRSHVGYGQGYYQCGLNRIGWTPEFTCPSDRWDNLNINVEPMKHNEDGYILVCGQKFGDGQHGMDEYQMKKLMAETCKTLKLAGYEVRFKPHPKSEFDIEGFETAPKSVEEALDGAQAVVSYNSTIGTDALLRGVPVEALSKEAHYAHLNCGVMAGPIELPAQEEVVQYLHKLAYSQWTRKEIEAGMPLKFLLKVVEGKDPFDGTDYTREQPRGKPAQEGKLDVTGLKWHQARAKVKQTTGQWPKSKKEMYAMVEEYNARS